MTCLRDTVGYVNAAFNGKSIFDLPHDQAKRGLAQRGLAQWQLVMEWLNA